jgi:hypothetical protein
LKELILGAGDLIFLGNIYQGGNKLSKVFRCRFQLCIMMQNGKHLDGEQIEGLLNLPNILPLSSFAELIDQLVKKRTDKHVAAQELDVQLAILQNHIQLLALYIKQNYLIVKPSVTSNVDDLYYTKQEIANKYRVSVRTVTNWIIDGLEVEEVGGIKRISFESLERFRQSAKGKKFHWKSIAR